MADNTLPLFEASGKYYVYVYRDPRPGKKRIPIYVGKGTAGKKRADVHWRQKTRNPILRGILSKIKQAGLEPLIEIVAWYDNEAAAFKCEISMIALYGRRDLGAGPLCNLTDGGDGTSGYKPTPDQRVAMSQPNIGRKNSPETITRMKQAAKQRVESAERIAKLIARNKSPRSEITRQRVSQAKLGRAAPNRKLSEAQVLEIYGSRKDHRALAHEYDVSMSCIGMIRCGYSWNWLTKHRPIA
jgi:hypothetical protein